MLSAFGVDHGEISKAGFRLPGSSAFRGGGAQTGGGQGISAGLMKPQQPKLNQQKPGGGAASTFAGGPAKPGGFAGGPAKKPAAGGGGAKGPMQAFMAGRQKRMGMQQKRPGSGVSSAPSAGFGSSFTRS